MNLKSNKKLGYPHSYLPPDSSKFPEFFESHPSLSPSLLGF